MDFPRITHRPYENAYYTDHAQSSMSRETALFTRVHLSRQRSSSLSRASSCVPELPQVSQTRRVSLVERQTATETASHHADRRLSVLRPSITQTTTENSEFSILKFIGNFTLLGLSPSSREHLTNPNLSTLTLKVAEGQYQQALDILCGHSTCLDVKDHTKRIIHVIEHLRISESSKAILYNACSIAFLEMFFQKKASHMNLNLQKDDLNAAIDLTNRAVGCACCATLSLILLRNCFEINQLWRDLISQRLPST